MKTLYVFPLMERMVGRMNPLPDLPPFAVALLCLTLDLLIHGPALLVVLAVAGLIGMAWKQNITPSRSLSRRASKAQGGRRKTGRLLGLGLFWLITLLAFPAQAQFFGGAETWMQSNFGADAGDAIPLVFNVLRGLFLLYVGISLVRVINGARQDEDWQTIARTPLIIIIAVTAGDVLTTLITG
ncbi:hypothetical protein IQ254_00630 [Nodosilinea sp. LEGE 07088]|uniref:hypothetical protein n=1 Tax=Nodosilinea sp. LEGE 07088 TaxID=2777968 RepID=UPI0018813955|nr:hypothetical protein [Nodosilinea sp. LEGE 07088]MBE9135724.1 hypothetical protein [Nodosilinea sp. LEGE 07088]